MKRFNQIRSMSNLKEVAKKAGVSVGTASAVFNGKNWVSNDLRLRVLKAAKEFNYRPNRIARNLRSNTTNTIGVLVTNINSPFFSQIMKVLSYECHKNGLNLFFSDTNCDENIIIKSLNDFLEHKVDGIILLGIDTREQLLRDILFDVELPIISIEGNYSIENMDYIQADAFQGGYIATKHLLELGYYPISIITGPLNPEEKILRKNGWGRFKGYLKALEDKGVVYNPEYSYKGNFLFDDGVKAIEYFLTLNPLPRAIFASNDMMAINAMQAIKEKGLRVPEDIAIVGFDDIPAASFISPALTTVRLPQKLLGNLAVDILMSRLQGKSAIPLRKVLPVEIVVRESCGFYLGEKR